MAVAFMAPDARAEDASGNPETLVAEGPTEIEQKDLSKFSFETMSGLSSRLDIVGLTSITYAPFGILNESGVRFKIEGGGFDNRFKQNCNAPYSEPLQSPVSVHERDWTLAASTGYEYVLGPFDIVGFIGVGLQHTRLSRNKSDNEKDKKRTAGAEFATEVDYRPIQPLSLSLNANYSTASRFLFTQARLGFAVTSDVFVGPEFGYQRSQFFQEWRVGAHLGQIDFGAVAITVAGGLVHDRTDGNGIYGTIESSFRF
jgi:hypothetical protein